MTYIHPLQSIAKFASLSATSDGVTSTAYLLDGLPDGALRHDIEAPLDSVKTLILFCHSAHKHWWTDPKTGADIRDNPLCFSNKLALVHSEVSEALEGDRKDVMDDHLPHRKAREVELADALIRIFDLAGAYQLDLAGALVEKVAYNQRRADHKVEARVTDGGKAY